MRTDAPDQPGAANNKSALIDVFRSSDLTDTLFKVVFNNRGLYAVDLPSDGPEKSRALHAALFNLCGTDTDFYATCQAQLVRRLQGAVREVQKELPELLENVKVAEEETTLKREDCHVRNLFGWDVWDLAARRNGVEALRHLGQLVNADAQPVADAEGLIRRVIPYAKDETTRYFVLTNDVILQLLPHVWGMSTWLVRHMIVYPKVEQWDDDEYEFDDRPTEAMYGPYETWDVSKVTNMRHLFDPKALVNGEWTFGGVESFFNAPIGTWDVSNVENMAFMFLNATKFNQPIGAWNVEKVRDMQGVFANASSFNQAIGMWNVSNVKDMDQVFRQASSFNQPLGSVDVKGRPTNSGGWDVSNVTRMNAMFLSATSFNQPIGKWDVSKVENMIHMFYGATNFNQPIVNWNVSRVWKLGGMLFGARNFDQELPKFSKYVDTRVLFIDW
jgi:hypothetical protein